jgi:hypothetical protein
VTESSPGTKSGATLNPVLLVVGSALVGALLAGGIKIDLPSNPSTVVVVQLTNSSPGAAAAVTASGAPVVAEASTAPAEGPTPTPVPIPAPRIQTFDWASEGGAVVGIVGLAGLVLIVAYAGVTAWSRRAVPDDVVTFDARPDAIRGAAIAALSLVLVGLGVMLLSPTIEVIFDDNVRIVSTAVPSVCPSNVGSSTSACATAWPSALTSAPPSSSPSPRPSESAAASGSPPAAESLVPSPNPTVSPPTAALSAFAGG